jgi:hypothetical protein
MMNWKELEAKRGRNGNSKWIKKALKKGLEHYLKQEQTRYMRV